MPPRSWPGRCSLTDVFAGRASYDGLEPKEQAVVRVEWFERMRAYREELDLTERFVAEGRAWVELDDDARVVERNSRVRETEVQELGILDGVVSVSRRIDAPADHIFHVLADPARHTELDGSGMLRGVSSGGPISAVGDRFVMKMYFDRFGGDYLMDNHVIEFEPGRRIAWAPSAGDERAGNGATPIGVLVGHRWMFELAPDGDATLVTETYDCTDAPDSLRQVVANGEAWRSAMEETLAKLDATCMGGLRSTWPPDA